MGGDYVDFQGVVSDTGSITKAGAGRLIFSVDNTYTGSTTISGGTLQLGNPLVNSGTTGSINSTSGIVNNGTLAFNRTDSGLTIGAVISGTGAVNQMGAGITILTRTNTYTGLTTISAGTLQLGAGVGGGTFGNISDSSGVVNNGSLVFNRSSNITFAVPISGSGVVSFTGTGIISLTGTSTYSGVTTISAGTMRLGSGGTTGSVANTTGIVNNATLGFNRSNVLSVAVPISGTGAVVQLGTGTTSLSGLNSYGGGTTVTAGGLSFLNIGSRPATGITTVAAGATLGLGVGTAPGFFTAADVDALFDGTLVNVTNDAASIVGIDTTAGDFTYGTSIPGVTRGLAKLGPNTLTLGGINGYTGTTLAGGGALDIGLISGGALGAGGLQFANDGVLQGNGNFTRAFSGSVIAGAGQISGTNGGFAAKGGTLTVNFGGAGALVNLSTTNARFGTNFVFGSTSADNRVVVVNPIDFNLVSGTRTITVLSGLGGDSAELQGALTSSASGITKAGTGLLILSGTSTYGGETVISAGTLQVGNGGTSGSIAGTSGITNNGTLAYNRRDALAVATAITGSGVVNQIGAGVVTFGGVNTYAGGTNINSGGMSFLNLSARPATGVVTVAAGATLGLGVADAGSFFRVGDVDNLWAGSLAGVTNDAASIVGIDATAGSFSYGTSVATTARGLAKLGANTLVLSGANGYTGPTFVRGGVLRLENANAVPGGIATVGGLGNLVLGGGVLGLTAGSGDFTRGIGAGAEQVRWLTDTASGFAAFGGDRSVNFGGVGDLVTWTNTGGVFGSALVLGDSASDGTITIVNPIALSNVANNRVITVHDGSAVVDAVLAGVISSETTDARGTRLIKSGLGTLALTGENTYVSGSANVGTTINAGTLQLGNGGTTGSISALAGTGINSDINILTGATLAFNRSDVGLVVGNTILGGGGVRQVGLGTTTLAVANIYTGVTTVSGGQLAISFEESLGAEPTLFTAGQLLLNGGGLLTTTSFALNDANRGVTMGVLGGAFNVQVGTELGMGLLVAGPGALTKRGEGTLVVNAVTGHSGGTVVEAGVLRVGVAGAIGGNVTISGTGAVDIGTGPFEVATLSLAGSVAPIIGTGSISATTGFTLRSASDLTVGSVLGGAGALTQSGTGTTTLAAANTFTGATVLTAGKLSISAEENLGVAPAVFTADQLSFNGGTLLTTASFAIDDANRGITMGALGGTFETAPGTVLTLVSPVTGVGLLTKAGDGELALSTASTHTGGTTVAGGRLRLGVANAIGGAVTLSGSGVLEIGTNALAASTITVGAGASIVGNGGIDFSVGFGFGSTIQTTVSNVLGGAGALTKTGASVLTLTAANTYTGGSLVSEGALFLSGGSVSTGTVSVASAASFGGVGTLAGPVVLNGGTGYLAGEQSILNVGGGLRSGLNVLGLASDLTVGAYSILDFYLSSTGLTKLDVDGLLTLDTTSRIRINLAPGYVPSAGSAFDLLDWGTLSLGGGLDLADLLMPLPNIGPETWVFDDGVFASIGVLKVDGSRTGPAITTDVVGGRVFAGDSVTLSVAVTGSIPFDVQWYKGVDDSNPIVGAKGFSYVIPSAGAGDIGTYWVRVTNDVSGVSSQFAALDVVTVPRIETQPVGGTYTLAPGLNQTFTVAAIGAGSLTYVWKKNGNAIVGAPNAASYTITGLGLADSGDYTVSISNAFTAPTTGVPATTSAVAVLTVRQPFEFLSQPQSQTVPEGNLAQFAVGLSDDGPFMYRWEFDAFGGAVEFVPLNGETGATLTRTMGPLTQGDYRVVVSNGAGSRTSNLAPLRFGSHVVVIDQQPVSKVVAVGSTLELTVVSSGGRPQRYQWFFKGRPVGDETDATLRIEDVTGARAGAYFCRISNTLSSGSDTKNTETVMVAVVDRRPGRFVVTRPGAVSLSVTAFSDRTDLLTYQWYLDEGLVGAPNAQRVDGATSRTLRVSGLTEGRKRYFCRVSAGSGSRSLDGGDQLVFVTTRAPELKPANGWSLPDTVVSQPYSFQVPMVDGVEAGQPDPLKAPASFRAVGLPAGLTINSAGLISGRATAERRDRTGAVIPYTVTITATNKLGTTAAVTKNLVVNPLDAGLIGTFTGPVDRSVGLNGNLGGVINFKTSKTGSYSGSVTMGSLTYGFKGALDTLVSDPTNPSVTLKVSRGEALRPLLVRFKLNAAGLVTGSGGALTRGTIANGRTVVEFDGWRNTWLASAANRTPALAYSGYYTMGMDLPQLLQGTATNPSIPQGTGYASFTVSPANGTMKVTGKLADGTGFTSSSYVGPTGEVLVFKTLYGAKTLGSVVGQMKINTQVVGIITDNTLSGAVSWWKPAQAGRAYAAGFGPFDLGVLGSVYVPPVANTPVMGLAANATGNNARLSLGQANVEAAQPVMTGSPANTVAVRVDNANKVFPDVLNNPRNVTVAITAATGLVTCKVGLSQRHPFNGTPETIVRAVSGEGMIVKNGAVSQAWGYFLLPQLPVGFFDPVAQTPILSGQMVFEGIP